MQDHEFWASTPREVGALLHAFADREEERERAATLRAALIAAEIHNAHRADSQGRRMLYKGQPVEPGDYLRQPVQYVDGETLRDIVHSWLRKGAAEA